MAQSLVLSGSVLVNDKVTTKVGTLLKSSDLVRTKEVIKTYVSRGAYKLLGAFSKFPASTVLGKICVDLGASTGGFTQVLLEKDAKHVFAVDFGYGQMAQKIANDPKVTVLDRMHVKELSWNKISNDTNEYFFTMDLSFISLTEVFPSLSKLIRNSPPKSWEGISLLKPQFELPARYLVKGVVQNQKIYGPCIRSVWRSIRQKDPSFCLKGLAESPIQGADGNREFLLFWEFKS